MMKDQKRNHEFELFSFVSALAEFSDSKTIKADSASKLISLFMDAECSFSCLGRIQLFGGANEAMLFNQKEKSAISFIKERLKNEDRNKELRSAFESGQYVLIKGGQHYPDALNNIAFPPPYLFVKGEFFKRESISYKNCITVIGSRKSSPYGENLARRLGRRLAAESAVLVSGLAYGIDIIAQRAALQSGGKVIAVLASPLDKIYPEAHRGDLEEICKKGGAISEHPPGAETKRYYFPLRNRLMSGMSSVTAVVEAALRSGTLITVEAALEQGRDVYACPGNIFSPESRGCNRLLSVGAGVLWDIDVFIEEIKKGGFIKKDFKNSAFITEHGMDGNLTDSFLNQYGKEKRILLKKILATVASGNNTAEKIMDYTGLDFSEFYSCIAELEKLNVLRSRSGVYFINH